MRIIIMSYVTAMLIALVMQIVGNEKVRSIGGMVLFLLFLSILLGAFVLGWIFALGYEI